jgi:hypothetical protein
MKKIILFDNQEELFNRKNIFFLFCVISFRAQTKISHDEIVRSLLKVIFEKKERKHEQVSIIAN